MTAMTETCIYDDQQACCCWVVFANGKECPNRVEGSGGEPNDVGYVEPIIAIYRRLIAAGEAGRGVRLSALDVEWVLRDDAITAAVAYADEQDEERKRD